MSATMPDPELCKEALDALGEGIQVISPDWRYLYVNQALARQGRKGRDELLGKTMHECYPGIEKTAMFSVLERCMRERRSEVMENEFEFESGQRAWFELRIRPCRAGLVIISLDITEQRSVEKRLEHAYLRALHDLVTPVLRIQAGLLLVPLVGAFDSRRGQQMTDRLLAHVVEEHARVVIIDIAGVPAIDTAVAHDLLQTTAMLRVLGARAIVTGMTPAVAKAIVQLGVDLSAMQTTSELAEGIVWALSDAAR